ncbi:hypothetical protein [Microbacterium sp. NPDC097977]|uniref:hypothetical protein n=1 Tax=Microbacterium sp. NPDC097977 TaxID=3155686 RepID=UPI0033270196
MSELSRRPEPSGRPDRARPDASGPAELSEDYGDLGERRNRRIRLVAWTVIVALILGGGGATVLSLLIV